MPSKSHLLHMTGSELCALSGCICLEVGLLRIGCGAGFSSDRLEPAVDMAQRGALDFLVFETIGERTLAFGHRDRKANPAKGYNPHLEARLRGVLPHTTRAGTRVVTNMGVANVEAAAEAALGVARELGLEKFKVATVHGDEITHLIGPDTILFDSGERRLSEVEGELICANAYLGAGAILPALTTDADLIITGRVADPSMFVAPLAHHYGWSTDAWPLLGQATAIGHLMECGMQITGGYFADPGFKDVAGLDRCGYPIAEVAADGSAAITKLTDTGGAVTERTVKEQLLYEVHDPATYLTPDVTADFSTVRVEDSGDDRVTVSGAGGTPRPEMLKATVAFDGGHLAEAEVSYAGLNAVRRAQLAAEILESRLGRLVGEAGQIRIDLIGINALHATAKPGRHSGSEQEPSDVRVRVAQRTACRSAAEMVLWETEALLCCGPAGGGGFRGRISPSVVTWSTLIPRSQVEPTVRVWQL